VPTRAGAPVTRAGDRFAAAVYPFLTGQSFAWDEFPAAHRRAVLDLVVRTHSAPAAVARTALADDFAVPYRAELEYACGPAGGDPASRDPASGNPAGGVAAGAASSDVTVCGPYTRPAAELIRREGPLIRRLLARYDDLAWPLRRQLSGAVLTHGEPHPGNTMLTADGWVLIDWDTALLAPPERDLWDLDPGDGTILAAYAQATGITPRPAILDLYRLRWDLTDLALDVSRFRRPHTGTPDDQQSWDLLQALVARLAAAAGQAS
jgi:spectinomycin phosphotransferase/16S rRNA (guanine(1405)-N(7))-methyltransferase